MAGGSIRKSREGDRHATTYLSWDFGVDIYFSLELVLLVSNSFRTFLCL